MINWIKQNKSSIIRTMFLVPIILVAIISISHVISWYDLSNPITWAYYLSISIEVAAMTALAAASVKIRGFSIWIVFSIVTFIQLVGNIYFSYKEIDVTDPGFKSWVELISPLYDTLGIDSTDILVHKRWLAMLTGGLLPLISLTCLHYFIKYDDNDVEVIKSKEKVDDLKSETFDVNNIQKKPDMDKLSEENKDIDERIEDYITLQDTEKVEYVKEHDIPNDEDLTSIVINDSENINTNVNSSEEEKKNSINDEHGESPDKGTSDQKRIQMGKSKEPESIIYKKG